MTLKVVYKWRMVYSTNTDKKMSNLMKRRYKNTFRGEVLQKIQSKRSDVILWSDLADLGGARQISRALKDLVEDGRLVRIGRGIYAKSKISKYINEPVINIGFEAACLQVLKRLNINWELSQFIKDYNEGKTQQIPAQLEVRLKSRFRRELKYDDNKFRFEGKINAK